MVDVVIVGSGAAGGWASKCLTEAGLRVVVLDAGPSPLQEGPLDYFKVRRRPSTPFCDPELVKRQHVQQRHPAFTETSHKFFADDVANPYTSGPNEFSWIRSRQVGGRTLLWGGQTWRLSDFEMSPSGLSELDGVTPWPLKYSDLAPFYDEIESALGVAGGDEDYPQLPRGNFLAPNPLTPAETRFRDVALAEGLPVVLTRSVSVRPTASGWPSFSSQEFALRAAADTGLCTIISNAAVEKILLHPGKGLASGVSYVDAVTKERKTIEARAVVLAASTIESVRILLNSAPGGLANESGVLGKYFVDHPMDAYIVQLPPELTQEDPALFWNGDGIYIPRFRNIAAREASYFGGFGIALWLGRKGLDYFFRAADPDGTKLGGYAPDGLGAVLVVGECTPKKESTISLAPTRDDCGIPTPHVNLVYGENERAMLADARAAVERLTERIGAKIIMDTHVAAGLSVHELGGARFGDDPATSYLDPNCRSWSIPNLCVVDGACWPTAAYQNPTLTIMAVALRASRSLATWLGAPIRSA